MQGPTKKGVGDLIALDPDAYWDAATNTVKGSLFPEFTSPRVCKIAMYDYNLPPEAGRNYVTVIRLGAFFVIRIEPNGDVIGTFIEITTSGPFGPGDSDLLGVRLVG
jgi:hypothetical protein